jgi:hypothetical protein
MWSRRDDVSSLQSSVERTESDIGRGMESSSLVHFDSSTERLSNRGLRPEICRNLPHRAISWTKDAIIWYRKHWQSNQNYGVMKISDIADLGPFIRFSRMQIKGSFSHSPANPLSISCGCPHSFNWSLSVLSPGISGRYLRSQALSRWISKESFWSLFYSLKSSPSMQACNLFVHWWNGTQKFHSRHLKRHMCGFTGSSPENILSELYQIFSEIPWERLVAVQNNWIARVEWTVKHGGESKVIRYPFHWMRKTRVMDFWSLLYLTFPSRCSKGHSPWRPGSLVGRSLVWDR